jgi:hypothetical protein
MFSAVSLLLSIAIPEAHAGKCDALLKSADTAKGDALVKGYSELVKCDKKLAEDSYVKFMAGATDSDTLVGLTQAAVVAEIWTPVWGQLGKITSYEARDEVARRVGEGCATEAKYLSFLQGAYFGLRDFDFQQWDDALVSCDSPAMTDWLKSQVEAPPEKSFDEKYNLLLSVYVRKQRGAALPSLTKGAIKAAKAGPYDSILQGMDTAVAPEMGESMKPEDQKALEDALIAVAKAVGPEKARAVADRLAAAGAESAAARLLPSIYPDRVKSGNTFLYGAAAIEEADCKGTKTAIVHYLELSEPGKRWSVLTAAEEPVRGSIKPKLSKCTAVGEKMPVTITSEPVKDAAAIEKWAADLQKQWEGKGFEVKQEEAKAIKLN